jgi:hypothetical protein
MSETRILQAKVAPPRPFKTADVVAVTSDEGEELNDTEFVAKVMHGQNAVVHRVADLKELVAYLKEFESIRRLVFMFHAAPGEVHVGSDEVQLSRIARELREARVSLRCNELIIEGCNAGSKGLEMVAIMNAVQAQRASGYATYHAWGVSHLEVHKGESVEELEKKPMFKRIKRFIIAGQLSTAEMVARPGDHSLAIEFFASPPPDRNVIESGLSGSVERLNERGRLEKRTFTIANAQQVDQYDTVVGSMTIVTITR